MLYWTYIYRHFDKETLYAVKRKWWFDYIDYVLFDKFILNNEDTIEQTIKLVLKKIISRELEL